MNVQWLTENDEVVAEVNVDGTRWVIAEDRWVNAETIVSSMVRKPCQVTKTRFVTLDGVTIIKCRMRRPQDPNCGDRLSFVPGSVTVDVHVNDEATGMALT
jgi:hypothetical protein